MRSSGEYSSAHLFECQANGVVSMQTEKLIVGGTPLSLIESESSGLKIFAKLEWLNPWGSIKDRIAYRMIMEAERTGMLSRGEKIILEPTSGNTGIGLAGVCRALGYKIEVIVPEKISRETKDALKHMGVHVIETADDLCPRVGPGTDQSINLAKAMVQSNPRRKSMGLEEYFMPNQYENEANFLAHYESTGPEVWSQTSGEVTHFICGVGTGGTITGVGTYLKERNPNVKVIGVTPKDKGHRLQGLRNFDVSEKPQVLVRRENVVDEWIRVSDKDAFDAVKTFYVKHRVLVGPSSGAVIYAALQLASRGEQGTAVVVFADSGERYRSLYADVGIL